LMSNADSPMPLCSVCEQRRAVIVCSSWLGKFISFAYCEECRKRAAEPPSALEVRATTLSWTVLAREVDRITTFKDGRYMSLRQALEGTPRGRQLDALIGGDDVRLWLDDDLVDRQAPLGWVQVTTAQEAIELLDTGRVVELSLDHDLGDDKRFGRGIDVVDWLAQQQEMHGHVLWPREGITIHTANPAGRDSIARAIENYAGKRFEVRRLLAPGGKPRFTFSPLEGD
jgi:hypothetical protein